MTPVPARTRRSSTVCTASESYKEQWVKGETFKFKKSTKEKISPSKNTIKNRRQTLLLRRLEINSGKRPTTTTTNGTTIASPTSPGKAGIRRTRRMSVAVSAKTNNESKIPRSSSQKQLTPKQAKPPTATKMLAASTSGVKLPLASSKIPSSSSSSSSSSNKTNSSSKINSTEYEAIAEESWIDKITSPAVFYKNTPVSPQLKGAQRRKSYTAATSILEVDEADGDKKRPRDPSTSSTARVSPTKKMRASAASLARQKTPRPTAPAKSPPQSAKRGRPKKIIDLSPSPPLVKLSTLVESKSSTPKSESPPKSLKKSTRKTPVKSLGKKNSKSATKIAKSTLVDCSSPTKSPVKPRTSRSKSVGKLNTVSERKNIEVCSSRKVPSSVKKVKQSSFSATSLPRCRSLASSASNSSNSPPATIATRLLESSPSPAKKATTRSLKKVLKKVTVTGSSPTLTGVDYRPKTPKAPRPIIGRTLVVVATDIGSSPVALPRFLSHSSVAPSPLRRLVSASRANPFTPRPEAQPSKLLKQTMKKKFTSEFNTLKKCAAKDGSDPLVDPRLSTVRTPTRVMLREAGFVSGDTPASSPHLPPTPTSANRHSRSARIVASARRKIATAAMQPQQHQAPAPYTPVNSTPKGCASPLFSTYTGNNSSSNNNDDESLGQSFDDSDDVADFTQSRVYSEEERRKMAGVEELTESAVDIEEDIEKTDSMTDDDISGSTSDAIVGQAGENTDSALTDDAIMIHNGSTDEENMKKQSKKGYCSLM